jgi:uncharacterized membrane protein
MTMAQSRPVAVPNYRKWALFALMGLLTLGVISIDERFLIDKTDEEWAHIAPFQWWLLPHGLAGFVALTIGPFQFSQRLRRNHLALHRIMGRVYIAAICIAAPLAIYIGSHFDPDNKLSNAEDVAQAGGWMLCAILAWIFAMKRNIPLHRQWIARSYGFTFVFIMARAPHIVGWHWASEPDFVTYRWFLVFAALIVPDLILQADKLFTSEARPTRTG